MLSRPNCAPRARRGFSRNGFTLVEVLVATVLVLIMMATVVSVFASMSDSMRGSRAMIEVGDRLRHGKDRLQSDLAGITVPMMPTQRPESGLGYFEIIEGPVGPILPPQTQFDSNYDGVINASDTIDSTIGDTDDILMFTTRSSGEPFVGRFQTATGPPATAQSQVAEVCWYLRGTTLYRRQLLVAPALEGVLDRAEYDSMGNPPATYVWRSSPAFDFYARCDLSVRQEGGVHDWRNGGVAGTARLKLNTLGDLTKRENRYGHQPWSFPCDARFWGELGLPTLRECSSPDWPFPFTEAVGAAMNAPSLFYGANYPNILPLGPTVSLMQDAPGGGNPTGVILNGVSDPWTSPFPWTATNDQVTGTLLSYSNGSRISDDVILTNVLSFDVKVWDPGAPIFQSASGEVITPSGEYPEHYRYKYNTDYDGTFPDEPRLFFRSGTDFTSLSAAEQPIAYGAYVDLNYLGGTHADAQYPPDNFLSGSPQSHFAGNGNAISRVSGYPPNGAVLPTDAAPAVYDTWSQHYEHDGFDQDLDDIVDEATNGLDDIDPVLGVPVGGVDDDTELEAPPPYPVPLRGIQVKIRVFEPGTRQIREVTVVQDFVAQ